ncbi:MAG: adenosine-specific kinase [Bryobacterales bacterium]
MELKTIRMQIPEGANLILGQSHFIKTVEDLYEAVVETAPHMKFGLAFNEASGDRLVRLEGNDLELRKTAADNALALGAGHCFVLLIREGFPINILHRVKDCQEVVTLFCATANPVEVILAKTEQGCGILGVIDGHSPAGVEKEEDVRNRHDLLRKFGYKR